VQTSTNASYGFANTSYCSATNIWLREVTSDKVPGHDDPGQFTVTDLTVTD